MGFHFYHNASKQPRHAGSHRIAALPRCSRSHSSAVGAPDTQRTAQLYNWFTLQPSGKTRLFDGRSKLEVSDGGGDHMTYLLYLEKNNNNKGAQCLAFGLAPHFQDTADQIGQRSLGSQSKCVWLDVLDTRYSFLTSLVGNNMLHLLIVPLATLTRPIWTKSNITICFIKCHNINNVTRDSG